MMIHSAWAFLVQAPINRHYSDVHADDCAGVVQDASRLNNKRSFDMHSHGSARHAALRADCEACEERWAKL